LRPEASIVVAGDSAGGGLTLSLLVALRDRTEVLPAGAFVFSPWTDLAATGASVTGNERKDVWLRGCEEIALGVSGRCFGASDCRRARVGGRSLGLALQSDEMGFVFVFGA